ncbi:MAG: proprotein convertase P-domain-containing protein [Saprospiraceae bacterium]|nr:proprotein convertase P-domain-containing protein [Saprospiraceae bacterium]
MKSILSLMMILISTGFVAGQNYWTKLNTDLVVSRGESVFQELPEKYSLYSLDHSLISLDLLSAPKLEENFVDQKFMEMVFPLANGKMEGFKVFEQPVMEEGLSQKYPFLKAYKGICSSDPTIKIWITVSPYGFSAVISTPQGIEYVDKYFMERKDVYIVYNVDTYKNNPYAGIPLCGVDPASEDKYTPFMPFSRKTEEVETRTYRLAMACTGEWGGATSRGTVAKCLADMNIMVTRLTQIYEDQLAMRFVLVNDNDKIIFLDKDTDPYIGSDKAKTILPTNTGILNDRIGVNNYDIGHVLSICFDVGGVAHLGSACQSLKGNGVTCFNDSNFEYAVASIMAHEVGHQFDATHTWNSCPGSQDNVQVETAYEPGSGSTIMSYGGLCGSDNIFGGKDPYFHVVSLEQMLAKTLSGGNAYNCAQKTLTGNHTPVVIMPEGGFTIPQSTPFALSAMATDEDGDNLTYRWEQYNIGPQSSLGNPIGNAPLFRSFPGESSPTRFFPTKTRIFKNQLNAKDEVLPTITRDLKFKCVVRDEKAVGVGITWDEMSFSVTEDAGPFVITYPRVDAKFDVGQEINVTWDVANTNEAPVNCKKVNIFVSVNEALLDNDPNLILVAKEVPNNGSTKIIIPNKVSNKINFVIKAADNIFLTTSALPSIVQNPVNPGIFVAVDNDLREICLPASPAFEFETTGLSGLTENILFDIQSGLPNGAIASFSNATVAPGNKTLLTINMDNVVGKGLAEIAVRAFVPGVDTLVRTLRIYYTATNLNEFTTLTPADGTTGGSVLPNFSWTANVDAAFYQIQLATNPSFEAAVLVFDRNVNITNVNSSVVLEKSSVYYWRVRASNDCKTGDWSAVKAFSTEVLSCKEFNSGVLNLTISSSGTPSVETALNVGIEGMVNDINVKSIKCDHQRNGDIVASLLAPSGKEIILWSKKCGTQKNISLGLDDESPTFFNCPLNNNRILKPENKLSGFSGEQTKGNWTLKIQDTAPGEGGKLLEFNLELCSNVSVAAPSLVNNNVLQIPPGDKPSIKQTHLLVTDTDNTAEQLTYTIVTLPTAGTLGFNGNVMVVGSVFTQADINNDKIRYTHNGSDNPNDQFSFTVIDGQGGWVPVTVFEIEIDASFPSKTSDLVKQTGMKFFPNPVNDQDINIVIDNSSIAFTDFIIFDVLGRKCFQGVLKNNQTLVNVSGWKSGLYTVQILFDNEFVSGTFIKK